MKELNFHTSRNKKQKPISKIKLKPSQRVREGPSKTWSSGPMEESPQTSQTTLPCISPVQALTPETKIADSRKRHATSFLSCESMACFLKFPNVQRPAIFT